MFELRNVRAETKLIACAEDGETVHAIDLFCKSCGEQIDQDALDKWLSAANGFPYVFTCPRCRAHIVVDFSELEKFNMGYL